MSEPQTLKRLCFQCLHLQTTHRTYVRYNKRKTKTSIIHPTFWCDKKKESILTIREECSDFAPKGIQKRLGKNGKN